MPQILSELQHRLILTENSGSPREASLEEVMNAQLRLEQKLAERPAGSSLTALVIPEPGGQLEDTEVGRFHVLPHPSRHPCSC